MPWSGPTEITLWKVGKQKIRGYDGQVWSQAGATQGLPEPRTAGAMPFFLKHSFIGDFVIFLFGLILIYDYIECIYL